MPTCRMCGGSGMVPVSGVRPAHRPCPECSGRGWISEEEETRRSRERAKREAKKNKGFGWLMLFVGLGILYGIATQTDDPTTRWIGIGGAVVCFIIFGRNV